MSSPGGRIIAVASDSDGITADIRAIKERVVEMNARLAKLEGTPAPAPAKAAKSSAAPSADGSGNNIAASAADVPLEHPFGLNGRVVIAKLLASGNAHVGKELVVGGWVQNGRAAAGGTIAFINVVDGSSHDPIQIVVEKDLIEPAKIKTIGTSVLIRGTVVTKENKPEEIELKATEIIHFGPCDASKYPMAGKHIPIEQLRRKHFRSRNRTIQAMFRIRNALAAATHQFFQQNGFMYLHSPLITSSDCEGAGEMFQVTTLLKEAPERAKKTPESAESIAASAKEIADKQAKIAELEEEKKKSNKKKIKKEQEAIVALEHELEQKKKTTRVVGGLPHTEAGEIDYSEDFFLKPAYLTVSGQLDAEVYACSMSSVYTFGPTFRAEESDTTRHLAEFWMIEPEIAFCDLEGDMACAEQYVQFCLKHVLATCRPEMEFFTEKFDPETLARAERVSSTPFVRLTYTEAIDKLLADVAAGVITFEEEVSWGIDLSSEHERYLAEKVYNGPVILYNYPKDIKAFYMKLNDDNKTVAAMDVLVPGIGELVGGSQREDRLDVLTARMKENDLDVDGYAWYLHLREFGGVPHSGFGLGFERLVLFATGLKNIRDVIPFPRAWKELH